MLSRRGLLAALTTFTASCSRNRKKRIAVIPKATSHLFWVAVHEGVESAAKEFNVEVLWNGPPAETEYSRQIQIVDAMVAQHVDGIAVAPAERKALVSSVERAIRQNIPVTVFDSGLEITDYTSYVGTDNLEAGREAARTLAALIGNKGTVGVIMHAPGSASTMDREQGFKEVVKRDFPQIRIVGEQYGMSDPAKSRAAAENILTAHPNIDGLFASSEPSSIGSALAINSRNLSTKVSLVAFDSSSAMVADLRGGAIDAMIVQDPRLMGYEAVHTIVQKLNGQTPPKRMDLRAVVVRKQDLETPDIRRLLNIK